MNLAHIKFLSLMVIALCKVQTVCYDQLSTSFESTAQRESSLRRIQRFMAAYALDIDLITRLIFFLLPEKPPYVLSMDRTNWKFGQTHINILMIAISYQGLAFPLIYKIIPKAGNSSTQERIALMERYIKLFGKETIAELLADREFIGERWVAYLNRYEIPYHLRIRNNFWVYDPRKGKELRVSWLFHDLGLNQTKFFSKIFYVNKQLCYLAGSKIKNKAGKPELQIIISFKKPEQSIESYKQRWQIETAFRALKTSGFNIEDTHLTAIDRIEKLLAIVLIAFVWAYKVGIYLHLNVKEIKIKTHQRKAKSIFRYGLDYIKTILLNPCRTDRINVFNFFVMYLGVLQQTGPVDSYVKPYIDAPDLAFNLSASQKMIYNQGANRLTVVSSIVNQGDGDYKNDLKIDLYLYNTVSKQYRLVGTNTTPTASVNLPAKGSQVISFDINGFSGISMTADDRWTLVINGVNKAPNAPTYYFKGNECRDWNNLTQRISFVSGDKILCEDDEVQLELSPAGTYDYYWYLADGVTPYNGKDGHNKGDSKWVKKSGAYTDVYKILVVAKGGIITNPVSPIKDEVTLYLSPVELIWNGDEDNNWHNIMNWTDPNDPNKERVMSYIPRHCTNVLIPRGLDIYPDLTPTKTDYSVYDKAECYSIEYEHEGTASIKEVAGEMARPDLLTYNNVIAHLEAMSNRYYGLSFPLQDMFTGDVYKTQPNPYADGLITYTKKYAQSNPQSGTPSIEGQWTGYFNTPNEKPAVGNGLGVWLDDLNTAGTGVLSFIFPKDDAGYYTYNKDTHLPINYYATARGNGGLGKYIFTPHLDGSKAYIEVPVDSKTAGQTFLLGNPFLSHLDFNAFYQANSTLIQNYYKVLNGTGVYVFDTFYLSGGTTSGNPQLTRFIAPWQSVVLTVKAGAGTVTKLKIPVQASVNYVDKTKRDGMLRNVLEEDSEKISQSNYMTIAIADNEVRARTLIAFKEGLTTKYNPEFDVMKTFFVPDQVSDAGTSIYSLSPEGYYIDRKGIGMLKEFEIPLGFRSKFKGSMALTFENMHEFMPDFEEIYLLDKLTNRRVQLYRSYWPTTYQFENESTKAEVNNRFALVGSKQGSSIEQEATDAFQLLINFSKGRLEIEAPNGEQIEAVTIYDLSGRLVQASKLVSQPTYSTVIGAQEAVYVLNVQTDKRVYNQKLITSNY